MTKSILILDDDITFAETLGRSFNKRGLTCFVTQTTQAATSILNEHTPDYAVIDLKIDQESGLHFLSILAKKSPTTKSVILTGYSSISTTVAAMKLGCVNYLCKPLNTDQILHALAHTKTTPGIQLEDTPLENAPPTVNRLEWEHIQRVLSQQDGNISATAKALSMHRRTLQRKLQKKPVSR
ncbi:MAG: two-component system response regulator RegA [Oleiphilaceae bacterium]|jgi:two-component system response regulator RegA